MIKNSLNLVDNYITLDKGSSSGIHSEMGVVDGNGIVGIVYEDVYKRQSNRTRLYSQYRQEQIQEKLSQLGIFSYMDIQYAPKIQQLFVIRWTSRCRLLLPNRWTLNWN